MNFISLLYVRNLQRTSQNRLTLSFLKRHNVAQIDFANNISLTTTSSSNNSNVVYMKRQPN